MGHAQGLMQLELRRYSWCLPRSGEVVGLFNIKLCHNSFPSSCGFCVGVSTIKISKNHSPTTRLTLLGGSQIDSVTQMRVQRCFLFSVS